MVFTGPRCLETNERNKPMLSQKKTKYISIDLKRFANKGIKTGKAQASYCKIGSRRTLCQRTLRLENAPNLKTPQAGIFGLRTIFMSACMHVLTRPVHCSSTSTLLRQQSLHVHHDAISATTKISCVSVHGDVSSIVCAHIVRLGGGGGGGGIRTKWRELEKRRKPAGWGSSHCVRHCTAFFETRPYCKALQKTFFQMTNQNFKKLELPIDERQLTWNLHKLCDKPDNS